MAAKQINVSGKRKNAIARAAVILKGKGRIRINHIPLDSYTPAISRQKIQEPLILIGGINDIDIDIDVSGGGFMSQAEAARLVLSKALAKYNKKLEKIFLNYDRQLLVADIRRKETHKPNCHGKARSKRQKSYR